MKTSLFGHNGPNRLTAPAGGGDGGSGDRPYPEFPAHFFVPAAADDGAAVLAQLVADRFPLEMRTADGRVQSVVNADTTATGMPSRAVEAAVAAEVPAYGNTHSNALVGHTMSDRIAAVRELVARELDAPRAAYDVLFPGNGCTMAVKQLIHILGITERPTEWYVLISENEHHAVHLGCLQGLNGQNCVCSRDGGGSGSRKAAAASSRLWVVPVTPGTGMIRRDALAAALARVPRDKRVLCFFNHGSNVTGSVQDDAAVNRVCRRVRPDAVIAWDYACSLPYREVRCAAVGTDAVVCSPHKCMGGNGTPGLLVVRKDVRRATSPFVMAGGITQFIGAREQVLSFDQENLESAGSPNGLGILRLGEVLRKRRHYLGFIEARNRELARRLYTACRELRTLRPLDESRQSRGWWSQDFGARLPIVSLVSTRGLHYNLYCAVLSDFFAIMTRGGLSCCSLLYQKYRPCCRERALDSILGGHGMPCTYGGVRVSLNYAMTDEEVDRVIAALRAVDRDIDRYAPLYRYNPTNNHFELLQRRGGAQPRLIASAATPATPAVTSWIGWADPAVAAVTPGTVDGGWLPLTSETERTAEADLLTAVPQQRRWWIG